MSDVTYSKYYFSFDVVSISRVFNSGTCNYMHCTHTCTHTHTHTHTHIHTLTVEN